MYMEQLYSTGKKTLRHLPWLMLGVLMGCPSYEDARTGTYREVPSPTNLSGELLELELFRFGDYSKAIVRTYKSSLSEDPFTRQSNCAWTDLSSAPDDEGKLRLHLDSSSKQQTEEISFSGTFINDQELELTLNYPQASPPRAPELKRFQLYKEEPNNRCDTVGLYPITLDFDLEDGAIANQLPSDITYTLQRPTFVALWLGVRAQTKGDSIVWVANQSARHATELGSNNRTPRGLAGDLTLSLATPDEDMLIASGNTRYAIAHPVIIDDSCQRLEDDPKTCAPADPDARFSWDTSSEPIIATALELGQEQSDDFPPEATGLGKAILFVEGSLSELHPNLQDELVNVDKYTQESSFDNRHFYIVDIFFHDNDVVGMRLPSDPKKINTTTYRNITLKVTKDYLNSKQIPLPRRKPIDETF